MIRLGDYNTLKVARRAPMGIYLEGDEGGDILLPAADVPAGSQIGDEIEVFIYLDQEERRIATTARPLVKVGEFGCLEVSWVNRFGAFLKWGLMKDLFCPFREQKKRMQKGEKHIVYVYVDEESYRLVATAKVDRFLEKDPAPYRRGDEVDLLVWQKTDLGFKVIIDNRYGGLLYDDQIFRQLHTGDRLKGYIQTVREDGKIDVGLQQEGYRHAVAFAATLLDYLKAHDGYCDLGDKSDAEEIKQRFQVSKKTYKKAVGDLYRQRLIVLDDTGIRLVNP